MEGGREKVVVTTVPAWKVGEVTGDTPLLYIGVSGHCLWDSSPQISGSLQGTFPFLWNSFSLERTQDEPEYVGGPGGVSFPSMQLSGYNTWVSWSPPDGFCHGARLLPLFFAAVRKEREWYLERLPGKVGVLLYNLTPPPKSLTGKITQRGRTSN